MSWTGIPLLHQGRGGGTIALLERYAGYWAGNKWQAGGAEFEVVSMATGRGGAYGVLKRTLPNRKPVRFALTIQVRRAEGEFQYKVYAELDGPVITGMPERLFKQLSSPDEILAHYPSSNVEHLKRWREAVQARLDRKKRVHEVKPGNVLEFAEDIRFGDTNEQAVSVRKFQVIAWGKRKTLRALPEEAPSFLCGMRRETLLRIPFSVLS